MPLQHKSYPKTSQKLKLYPHANMDLRVLEVPLAKLKELMLEQAENNPVLEIATDSPRPSQDRALEQYLTSGDDGHSNNPSHYDPDQDNADNPIENLVCIPEKFLDHLLGQLHILDLSPADRDLAEAIIGNIDENGFLRFALDEIAQQQHVDVGHIEKLLSLIQTFDPVGVGARDLKECLLIQLKARGKEGTVAFRLVNHCLPLLEKKQFAKISRQLNIPEDAVKAALQDIAALEPKPGRNFSTQTAMTIVPDAWLEYADDGPTVIMNNDDLPVLSISPAYRLMLKKSDTSPETRAFIKERTEAARSLISAIKRRNDTVRQVIEAIVEFQKEYLTRPDAELKPMILQEIAQATGKDVSTVSRTIHNKYLQTRWRTIELCALFHGGVEQKSGATVSSEEIKTKLREIIEQEDKTKPLSDQDLVTSLQEAGITISRRAVTKYREQLGLLPSLSRRE